jgi:phosphatidylglycerophosphate synthase
MCLCIDAADMIHHVVVVQELCCSGICQTFILTISRQQIISTTAAAMAGKTHHTMGQGCLAAGLLFLLLLLTLLVLPAELADPWASEPLPGRRHGACWQHRCC